MTFWQNYLTGVTIAVLFMVFVTCPIWFEIVEDIMQAIAERIRRR